ncbi:MAG TPA: hypothetical protein VFK05_24105 [Polyangiaceae bacterium]|nr:hypothetical protein [Polyangiaceae bacterium]
MRGPGAEDCPDQTAVRDAVRKRLGYDPFFPSADKTIIARIERDAGKLQGVVELVDEHGTQAGKREFSAEQGQCEQLVHAMALSISIAIDPKSAETYAQGPEDVPALDSTENQPDSELKPEPASAPPAAVARAASSGAQQTKPSRQPSPWLWSAGLGGTVQFGSLPQVAPGVTAVAALRTGSWSLALEGELDLPVTTQEQDVELSTSSGALRLAPCAHFQFLRACQVTALRWYTATGSASGLGGTAFALGLGARLAGELPLSSTFGVLAHGDLLLTPLPVHLVSEGHELWKTPIFTGGLGIVAVVHFR